MASRNFPGRTGRERRCSRWRVKEEVYLLALGLCLLPLERSGILDAAFFGSSIRIMRLDLWDNGLMDAQRVIWGRPCRSGSKQGPECCHLLLKAAWTEVLSSFGAGAHSFMNAENDAHGFELELHSTLYSECCSDIRWFIFTTPLCKNYPQFRDKKIKWLSEDSGWELFLIA